MRFDSLQAFLLMDGHGAYVWMAYGITLLVLGVNLWLPRVVKSGFVRSEKRFQQATSADQGENS